VADKQNAVFAPQGGTLGAGWKSQKGTLKI